MSYILAIHGGAGSLTANNAAPASNEVYGDSLNRILEAGRQLLDAGESALDVVEQVVMLLENDPLYNAGHGAVLTCDGRIELDATIMCGNTRRGGGVGNVTATANPVRLARLVMEQTEHMLLAGPAADRFGADAGLPVADWKQLITPRRADQLKQWQKQVEDASNYSKPTLDDGNTVGAVARDSQGRLAAATSTGGRTGQMTGRIGDSAIIGAGTYADDRTCAVSCTGRGEEFMRIAAASNAHLRMQMGQSCVQAIHEILEEDMPPQSGGMIAVAADGTVTIQRTTASMPCGFVDHTGRVVWQVWGDAEMTACAPSD